MKKSILIITYGREEEFLDTIKQISNYKKDDIELLILDNNSENHLEKYVNEILTNCSFDYKYFCEGINYGVAKGRNYLIQKALGEILITLDDDIEIEDINILINKVDYYFNENSDVGCLAFNIKNFYTKESVSYEIPHGNKRLDFKNNLYTYYFIGAGHAIKKSVYDKVGMYPEDLGLYGGEELDLSFRIIENKFKILYTADIIVYHKASPNGRMGSKKQSFYKYQNRLKVIYRYMPKMYVKSNIAIWSAYYILKSGNIKGVIETLNILKNMDRNEISKETVKYLKEVNARLIY